MQEKIADFSNIAASLIIFSQSNNSLLFSRFQERHFLIDEGKTIKFCENSGMPSMISFSALEGYFSGIVIGFKTHSSL